ncbi:fluoride efflux transporter CrcB [Proteus faecis]|uniref:Fluoride-specific ion channel FluC n=1 Tax=Proteus faecis TaxID=2050967 RepID=A0AAW7CNW2_9GAMM|nr:fluoride efflux transporter CrcB [Proteus faecis]MBG3011851.1 fluoride efflux transporter CrcB [Proteus mirabilis]MDO5404696.1 fluoride efflux transporter CrcB [Proteus sp. (in: enterobacteria)]QNH66600.1 fluoride efflux transporter CrcB [Proteus vulgaris]MCT8250414.1 fluoride efflux transporter CrcB [Proteus faecis]MDL5165499.1 fluoride efflux transporter CrcB [Proteus faecis]
MLNIAIAVFIGGGLGSVLRWLISYRLNSIFPHFATGTFIANCIGAFIIAFGIAWFSKAPNIDPIWKIMLTTGFCGGLTTFSTFSVEVVALLTEGKIGWALSTMGANLAGSFLMTAFAFWLLREM